MKMLNLISAVVVLGFTVSSNAAANYQFVGADNSIDTKICLAAVTNDMHKLRHNIMRSGAGNRGVHTGARKVARTLMCNDQIVANFAYKYEASETFEYLDRYTPKKYQDQRPEVTIKDIVARHGKQEETTVVLIASK
ncbi:MAG: hypothetical protein ACJAS1_007146 [Oleiphilaceae bacterium]|jgi:hypothetical protein